jgi:hypothetical protein
VRSLEGAPGSATFRRLDVSEPAGWQELAQWLGGRDRPLHGLVNNDALDRAAGA